jgi:chromosome partitioning protein
MSYLHFGFIAKKKYFWQYCNMLIAFTNLKGGVGKSTLAVHLASWLCTQGKRIALIDADTQHSSSIWTQEAEREVRVVPLHDPDDILEQAPQLVEEYDVVIADGPAGMAELSRAILLRADIALVLCGPGILDLRASNAAVRVIKQAQSIRSGLPRALFVPNKIQVNTLLSNDLLNAAAEIGIPVALTSIRFRQVYADAPTQGTTIFRMGTRAKDAIKELTELFTEVMNGRTPIDESGTKCA